MPSNERPGRRATYLELDEQMHAQISELAAKNGRSIREEIVHAIARHLKLPPRVVVTIEEPSLTEETIDEAPPKPKRGRKVTKKILPVEGKKPVGRPRKDSGNQ